MNRLYKHEDVVQMLTDVIEQIEENEGVEIVDRPMGWESVRDYAEEVVSDIPSAENKGEWMKTSDDWIDGPCGARYFPIHCSVCNYSTYDDSATNYCPNCGAKM